MRQQMSRIVPIAVALLLGGAAARAQGPQEGGPGQGSEQRPQREALHEKMSANREALHQLLESGTADANAVGELVLEGRKLREEGKALHDAEQKSIRAILTPDQQKKFDTMAERMRQRGPRGPEGFGPGGPGGPGGFGGHGGPDGSGFSRQPRSSQPPAQP